VKVAIAHEWIVTLGGSERVVLEFHQLYPDAPIFTSVYDPERAPAAFRGLDIRPSFLQRIPGATRRYPQLLPLMPLAFSRFDTRGYDLVLLSSHAASKAIPKQPGQLHVCYTHTPMRYAWDLYSVYVNHSGLNPLQRLAARAIFQSMRRWDRRSVKHIDSFIANSENVRDRIRRFYQRDAVVIPPPIDCERFHIGSTVSDYFLVVSRLVPYKRVEIAIEAFRELGWPLHVVGAGSELPRLQAMAGPNTRFLGLLDDEALAREYSGARALVFTANEDAGMVPLEAMASGRPVLAYGAGGVTEVVLPNKTGAFFPEQTAASLAAALRAFDPSAYHPALIRAHAERYDRPRFRAAIAGLLDRLLAERGGGLSRRDAERKSEPGSRPGF
jgi:glycosyltransferase involved in cell wall biosynthesis